MQTDERLVRVRVLTDEIRRLRIAANAAALERRGLVVGLVGDGVSVSAVARFAGVSRQLVARIVAGRGR